MATFGLDYSNIYARIQEYANIKNIEGSAAKAKNAALDAVRKIAANRRWLALRRQGTITPIASTQSYALTGLTGFNFPVRVYYLSNGIEEDIKDLKRQTSETQKNLEKLQTLSKNIVQETDKFVKRNEILVIERMLKDFQPLEFMRKKDVEELIDEKLDKTIKTKKTTI